MAVSPISTQTIVVPVTDVSPEIRTPSEYRLYKRRWYILFLFFNSYAANNVQWVQYSSIANTIQSYYNVSSHAVNWATSVFYVGFIVCIIPATWLFKTQGLRRASLLGIFLTALGAWIKVFSAVPDRFYLTFIGQTVAAVGQTFIFGINSAVAAAWFGPKEVATADSIAALGSMLGAVISFLFSPMIVFSDPKVNEVETTYELRNLFYISASYSTAVCILMIIYFPDKPPKSPSAADALAEDVRRRTNYIKSMKSLLTKKNYLLLLLDYSLSLGVLGSLSTLINPIILSKFPGAAQEAGIAGMLTSVFGFIVSPAIAIVVDRTHKYKAISIGVMGALLLSMIGFTLSVHFQSMVAVYITSALQGACFVAFYTFGYDYGSELAYPEPGGLSGMTLSAGLSLASWIFVLICERLLDWYGELACNMFYVGILTFCFFNTLLIKPKLKRRLIRSNSTVADVEKMKHDD